MNDLIEIINSVGFPIVACGIMYQQVSKLNNIILELTTTLKGIDMRLDSLENRTLD